MIKHRIITVEYSPNAPEPYRFRHNVWSKGKITRVKCERALDNEIYHYLKTTRDKYPRHIPFSAVLGEIIRLKDHYLGWYNLKKEDKDYALYSVYRDFLIMVSKYLKAKKSMYKVSNEDIENVENPNSDKNYHIGTCKMEIFTFYEWTVLVNQEYINQRDEIDDPEQHQMLGDQMFELRKIQQLLINVHEVDLLKCMQFCCDGNVLHDEDPLRD